MLDQITHLFRLKAIIEEGSLHKAAERLNVSQPALSRSIAQLEALFGRPLLERHARGVRPTLFGRKVLSASLRLKRHWELAEQELREAQVGGNIPLRIGAGPVWRALILPAAMVEIQKTFPRLVVEIYRAHPTKSYEDLTEGRLDVILSGVGQETQHPRLIGRKLAVVTNQIGAREDHPLFALAAFIPWGFFSAGAGNATNCMNTNQDLVKRIYFPRLAIPLATILSGLPDLLVGLGLLAGFFLYYGVTPGPAALLLPLFLLQGFIATVGFGIILAHSKWSEDRYGHISKRPT